MDRLLQQLDGALLVRYIDGQLWVWHGGQYINQVNLIGKQVDTIGLLFCETEDDVMSVEDELLSGLAHRKQKAR